MTSRHPDYSACATWSATPLRSMRSPISTARKRDEWLDAAHTRVRRRRSRARQRPRVSASTTSRVCGRAGLLSLTVPRALGGHEATLAQTLKVVRAVARGEPSTALILVMQCLYHLRLQANPNWPVALKERIAREAVRSAR